MNNKWFRVVLMVPYGDQNRKLLEREVLPSCSTWMACMDGRPMIRVSYEEIVGYCHPTVSQEVVTPSNYGPEYQI